MRLDLGADEYTFEAGLAAVGRRDYEAGVLYTEEAFHALITRVCHLATAGRFTVTIPPGARRPLHYGVAGLSGRCAVDVIPSTSRADRLEIS